MARDLIKLSNRPQYRPGTKLILCKMTQNSNDISYDLPYLLTYLFTPWCRVSLQRKQTPNRALHPKSTQYPHYRTHPPPQPHLLIVVTIKTTDDEISPSLHSFIHSLVFSPRGRSGRNQSPVMGPIWLLAHCILGKFLGIVCHCFPPPLEVPTFAATCLCVRSDARDPSSERWNFVGEKDVRL